VRGLKFSEVLMNTSCFGQFGISSPKSGGACCLPVQSSPAIGPVPVYQSIWHHIPEPQDILMCCQVS
jgi:hypothetical protein